MRPTQRSQKPPIRKGEKSSIWQADSVNSELSCPK
jgi:hypothetical protein